MNMMKNKMLVLITVFSLLPVYAFTLNAENLSPREKAEEDFIQNLAKLNVYADWSKRAPNGVSEDALKNIEKLAQDSQEYIIGISGKLLGERINALGRRASENSEMTRAQTKNMAIFERGGEKAVLEDIKDSKKKIDDAIRHLEIRHRPYRP